MNETERENYDALDKLLQEKEIMEGKDLNRYRYFEDLNNNHYVWFTHKQEDGKWHAKIKKAKIRGGWMTYVITKTRTFSKRKLAKRWCLDNCLKARAHQQEVLNRRQERKAEREAQKPKYTKQQLAVMHAEKQIEHYQKLQKKADTKIKALTTRKRTYQKRIRYHEKRIKDLSRQEVTQ